MSNAETKAVAFFTHSSGALLLATASALFLINLTAPVHIVQPHDPILGISLHYLFWIIGGMAMLIAFFCLFSNRPTWSMPWVALFAANYLACRIALYWNGCHTLAGFLGGFPYAFGISAKTANSLADLIFAYLIAGSLAGLAWTWRETFWRRISKQDAGGSGADAGCKISCPSCGGHIQFAAENLGQQIPCPHCQAAITLQKPENLKMTCIFCKEHIEFPAHALGREIPCPHCEKNVILREQP